MKRLSSNCPSSLPFRALILATAAMVFALSVFAASPELHAWVHMHEHGTVSHGAGEHGAPSHHDTAPPGADDDGCAIALFAQGVLCGVALTLFGFFRRRPVSFASRFESILTLPIPRYWLPPLCGPPLS